MLVGIVVATLSAKIFNMMVIMSQSVGMNHGATITTGQDTGPETGLDKYRIFPGGQKSTTTKIRKNPNRHTNHRQNNEANSSSKTPNIANNEYKNHIQNKLDPTENRLIITVNHHKDGRLIEGEISDRPAKIFLDTGAMVNAIGLKD